MKNEVIEKVMYRLMGSGFSQEQLETVNNALLITLSKYNVTKETTDLAIYEGDINQNLIQKFLISKRVSGRTDRTIEFYGKELSGIFRKMQKSCLDVTPDDIRLYLAIRETQDRVSKVTMDNELRCLRTFYAYLLGEEIMTKNPTLRLERIKAPKKKKFAFTDLEVETIRSVCQNERDRVIVEVLLSTGCRISEFVNAKISDIETDSMTVIGKGNKYRKTYLNAKAQVAIKQYLECRSDDNPYLMPGRSLYGKNDKHMDKGTAEAIVRDIGKRAGVKNVHPHRFRRTCATFALRRGMPLAQVSQMLGHESIATTQIYLDIDEKELKAAHEKYVV